MVSTCESDLRKLGKLAICRMTHPRSFLQMGVLLIARLRVERHPWASPLPVDDMGL